MKTSILAPGMKVKILVSEPFELGGRALDAKVVVSGFAKDAPGMLSVLLRLHESIQVAGKTWEYLVARPTNASRDLSEIAVDAEVDCAITGVPPLRVSGSDPLDLSWWRGGLALRGSLSTP